MSQSIETIQADFDKLALLTGDDCDHITWLTTVTAL